jgi:muramoyltetrapeptide carboxypeptidase
MVRRNLLRCLLAPRLTLLSAACCEASLADQADERGEWLAPPALRIGDTIMFVAPAGPVDKDQVLTYRTHLEELGFKVIVPKNLFRRDGYLAGSDEERARELNAAIADPEVDAIFPCRGGYGLTRILDKIDYGRLRKNPKIVTGFSDITALHLAIAREARVITFHSPMPQHYLWRSDKEYAYSVKCFWRMLLHSEYTKKTNGFVIPMPDRSPSPKKLSGGRAHGRLVGGNLTLISVTIGTPYEIEADGNILVIEDTDEKAYKIDRYLSHLRLAGILDVVSGIVVGTFDSVDRTDVEKIVSGYCSNLGIPVLINFPVGHTPLNATLPLGAQVELDADMGTLRLLENPVR